MARLVSRLKVIAAGSDAALSLALHDTAEFILITIRVLAPVDTGFLRDSYQKETVAQLYILIGTFLNYSPAQEFGTLRGYKFTPHVIPAFEQSEEYFRQQLVKRVREMK